MIRSDWWKEAVNQWEDRSDQQEDGYTCCLVFLLTDASIVPQAAVERNSVRSLNGSNMKRYHKDIETDDFLLTRPMLPSGIHPSLSRYRFMSLTAGAGTRCMSLLFHLQAY